MSSSLALLKVQARALRNRWSHARPGARLRVAAGLGLALATFFAFHHGTHASLVFVQQRSPLAAAMAERLIEAVLLLQLMVVGLSALLMALAQLFSSRETLYLAALPLPTRAIFGAKVVSVAARAGWMPTLVAAAVISASGRLLEAGALFYLVTALILITCLAVPGQLAVGLAAAAARWSPLQRARDRSLLLGVLAAATALMVLWRLEPRRLLDLASVEDLESAISHLRFSSARYLPAGDAAELLRALAAGSALVVSPLLRLIGWVVGAHLVGLVAFEGCFRPALSAALEQRQRPSEQTRATALEPPAILVRWVGRARAAMILKDVRLFLRDPAQWSQGLFIVALVAIYLASAASVPTGGLEHVGLSAELFAVILAYSSFTLSSMLLAAVALRFLFTAVSLEGRAAWLVLSSPLDARGVLGAKLALGFPALAALGLILVTGSGLLLGASWPMLLWTGGGVLLVARGLTGLAVGLGGAMPNFKASDPMKVSSGLGGLTFSASAIVYVFGVTSLLAFPAVWFAGFRGPRGPGEGAGAAVAIALVIAAIALTELVAALPLRAARRRLERGEVG